MNVIEKDTCRFITTLAAQLAVLAAEAKLDTIDYILEMTCREADDLLIQELKRTKSI